MTKMRVDEAVQQSTRMGTTTGTTSRRKILITGATGLLGRSLAGRLGCFGTVTGVGHSQIADGTASVDLRQPDSLADLVGDLKPDLVVHSAAYRDPDFCEEHPEEASRLNVNPVARLCELLPDPVPLVFISSDYVFDGRNPPYCEHDERRPVNVYGQMKVQAEDFVLAREAGLVLRIPLLIGAGPTWEESGFIYKTLAAIRDRRPSTLDHSGVRFPTWTEDVAEVVAHLVENGASGAYHYSSLRGGTKYEWALELARLTGSSADHISPDPEGSPSSAPRPGNTQLAVEKIRGAGFARFSPFETVAESVLRRFAVL